ncbi:unnamed protein product [Rotaria socialis]|uniref:Caspase family p20 domain-containing protein n=1 Tax=Rotaria socialis TaxID=392032 RepID=A0A817W0V5_9BILA|nr:unnamed protein product [Rotaria socialis]CAF4691638.1 unnamed protein product [Rotaria socialis]
MDRASTISLNVTSRRRALVIGNKNYKKGKTLQYCTNNAQDLYVKLCAIHFQTTLGTDLNCDEMESIVETFIKDICDGDIVFFFFSGYGAHWNDQNFLVPIDDNQITDPSMFKYQAVNAQDTLKSIMNCSPSAAIFMLDACRSYHMHHITGWTGSLDFGGLVSMEAPTNSLVIFPCQANKTISDKSIDGRHNQFMTYVFEYIDQPNLPFDDALALICDDVMNASNNEQSPFQVNALHKNLLLNCQNQSGIKHKLNLRVQQIINDAQNESMIDLGYQELGDRDVGTIIQEVIIKKRCSKLWLPGNKITLFGAANLAVALLHNTTLEKLYLYGNRLADKGVKPLAKALAMNNSALKVLNLQEIGITDIGVEYLSEMLQKNTQLTVLCLSKNDISDIGLRIFANCLKRYNNTLQCLDLSKNKRITDISSDVIQEMIEHKRSLNELSIYDCSLSRTGKEKLKKFIRTKKNINVFINNWDE